MKTTIYIFLIGFLLACTPSPKKSTAPARPPLTGSHPHYQGWMERTFLKYNMANVQQQIPGLFVQLAYADTANFLHQNVYGMLNKCYLHPVTVDKLVKAYALLKEEHPEYSFLLYDGARPLHVQVLMYELYRKMPVAQGLYLSHPSHASLHNYGAAIDLTLCDTLGHPIDMGTTFDHFGPESHIINEAGLLSTKKITTEAYKNRILLRRIMIKAGFSPILYEWWHFNACSRGYAQTHYTVIP